MSCLLLVIAHIPVISKLRKNIAELNEIRNLPIRKGSKMASKMKTEHNNYVSTSIPMTTMEETAEYLSIGDEPQRELPPLPREKSSSSNEYSDC